MGHSIIESLAPLAVPLHSVKIDPHYCDVIIKRWEDFTGRKAERTD